MLTIFPVFFSVERQRGSSQLLPSLLPFGQSKIFGLFHLKSRLDRESGRDFRGEDKRHFGDFYARRLQVDPQPRSSRRQRHNWVRLG